MDFGGFQGGFRRSFSFNALNGLNSFHRVCG